MNEGYQITRRPDATFYHGGVVGLVDFVLPAGQVNASEGDNWYLSDELFCFITTDIVQAWHKRCIVKPNAVLVQFIVSPR